jgi:hypothetical protein
MPGPPGEPCERPPHEGASPETSSWNRHAVSTGDAVRPGTGGWRPAGWLRRPLASVRVELFQVLVGCGQRGEPVLLLEASPGYVPSSKIGWHPLPACHPHPQGKGGRPKPNAGDSR